MKKLLIAIAILLAASVVNAQTWHTANQVTLAWDAVTSMVSGDPIPAGDTVRYQTYIKFQSTTATPVAVGSEITATQQVVSFSSEGRYYLCVDAARYPQGETTPIRSAMACSHDAAVTADGAFGVVYYTAPGSPVRLRLSN